MIQIIQTIRDTAMLGAFLIVQGIALLIGLNPFKE
jgi:hypothetical protein